MLQTHAHAHVCMCMHVPVCVCVFEAWSPAGGAVSGACRTLAGGALLEEVGFWELEGYSACPLSSPSLFLLHDLLRKELAAL